MTSHWDMDVPFEKTVETNWSEEVLGLISSAENSSVSHEDKVAGKRDSGGNIKEREGTLTEEKNEVLDTDSDKVEEPVWRVEREDIIPGKDVFLLNPCFTSEECKKLIAAAEEIGYGRTNYPKKYRYASNSSIIATGLRF